MSWRDQLQPGSFRGAAFAVRAAENSGGRRGPDHSYPQRDTGWAEDIGRAAARFTIDAIVIGADYMAARDALIAACEAKGPGTLVHPWRGTLQAQCRTYTVAESTEEGGMATFTIELVEAGEIVAAEVRQATADAAVEVADDVKLSAIERFAAGFSVARLPAFVEAAAADAIGVFTAVTTAAGVLQGGTGNALRTFLIGLNVLPGGLLRSPLLLAQAIDGALFALGQLGSSPASRVTALRRVMSDGVAFPPVVAATIGAPSGPYIVATATSPAPIGFTPARRQEWENQVALTRLITTIAAAEAVRSCSQIVFASYNEAAALRSALQDDLDALAVAAADAGDDAAADDLDRLRLIMVRDITARGGSLARIYTVSPSRTLPALALAHQLDGTLDDLLSRSADLVARNGIRHPGFVMGGQPVEVLGERTAGA
ncbi:DNA circularization N-terminal domain-containing protein [Sphingomonas naphthae]|uniref:DNA circularization N-terminal domain-containing protein n=1 Tax=Sphingomonas naphthae TaxID=1813468 RepID=A0ABY7TFW8_9SPHN|nr:DNA circularization N-terminal domain-containing protein [Sphingomonas naphthae]WCT72050.1 DNA circularization N-terminal domain-containing protein [Sphingomonas naphthae]